MTTVTSHDPLAWINEVAADAVDWQDQDASSDEPCSERADFSITLTS